MSTDSKNGLTYTARVPWTPAPLRLVAHRGRDEKLYEYRDQRDGTVWWSDGYAAFRGHAPAYLRQAYAFARQLVGVPVTAVTALSVSRTTPQVRLELPVASYEVHSPLMTRPLPVAVFAASATAPEIHVDARYLAYALERCADCSFWHVARAASVAVCRQGGELVGVIPTRRPSPRRSSAR